MLLSAGYGLGRGGWYELRFAGSGYPGRLGFGQSGFLGGSLNMPECGQMESLFGVAVAKMESAKRAILEVEQEMFPGMIRDDERSAWLQKLVMAHLNLERADQNIVDAAALIHPEPLGTGEPRFTPNPFSASRMACLANFSNGDS